MEKCKALTGSAVKGLKQSDHSPNTVKFPDIQQHFPVGLRRPVIAHRDR